MQDEPSPFGPGNPERPSLRYVFLRFLRHGLLAWGGPIAQIGMMHKELVQRDGWISDERFGKVLALYQALPGPEANELAVYFGHLKRGRIGGLLAGLGFMLPGVILVTLLAALYVRYAQTATWADAFLYGLRPAVLALVGVSFVRLARANLRGWDLALAGVASALVGILLPEVNLLLILLVAGLAVGALRWRSSGAPPVAHAVLPLAVAFPALSLGGLAAVAILSLKVGLLTFGGAYTALPFLHEAAVLEHGWMSDDQFLDALGICGLVPGPLIAIGTFVGYQAAGLAGAAIATLLIFAPAFAFTLVGHGTFERLVEEPRLHAFLLGVSASVVGLILVATIPLARAAVFDAPTLGLALFAAALLWTRRVPMPLALLACAALGLGLRALLGAAA